MAKAKHHKSKPNKQTKIKRHGKQAVTSEFQAQLDALGLKIIQVTADGNCFFRALGDQLEGNEEEHVKYRSMVVHFIHENRDMFEPFIEDDIPFDEYCQSMEKDGTWAGHMELQAASLVTHSNICIHRNMSPRWYIHNFDNHEARMIHLSYHDGEHYNSVRSKEDTCTGPARPITLKVDADLSAKSQQEKVAATKSKGGAGKNNILSGTIKTVMGGSGCEIGEKVEQILQQVGGDVDAAIEFLIAEKTTEEYVVKNGEAPCTAETSNGEVQNGFPMSQKDESESISCKQDPSLNDIERTPEINSLEHDEKRIPRNKACPCGSKKKYKSCCGSVAGKSSNKFAVFCTALSDNTLLLAPLCHQVAPQKCTIARRGPSMGVSDGLHSLIPVSAYRYLGRVILSIMIHLQVGFLGIVP
ncbi:hypothetical protein LguiA_006087 [Lonicera macranthoides]